MVQIMYGLLAMVVVISLDVITAQSDWCGLESCPAPHVDCEMGDGSKYGDACPLDAVMLNLAPVQSVILDEHNKRRNRVAGGNLPNYMAANRMGTMGWNVTLANLARKTAKMCLAQPDQCRNTPDYNYVGQNVAWMKYLETDDRPNIDIITQLIQLWFVENLKGSMAIINSYQPTTASGDDVGHFTQMVRDYATRCGCGATKYTTSPNVTLVFVCNYDMANIVGWPIYARGIATNKCTTGANPAYKNLCSTAEVYNVNTFFYD